jgi:hypothetical protein
VSNDNGPLINPPPSHDTPLASLDGWTLTISCPKCGPHHKPVSALRDELHERMRREAHAAGGRPSLAAAKPLGDILPSPARRKLLQQAECTARGLHMGCPISACTAAD